MSDRTYFIVRASLDETDDDVAICGVDACHLDMRFSTASASDGPEAIGCAVRALSALGLSNRVEAIEIIDPRNYVTP